MKLHSKPNRLSAVLSAIGLTLLAAATTAHASTWNGGSMSYNTPGNWSGGQVPSATVTGNAINNSGSNNVVQVNPGDPDWVLGFQDIHMGNANGTSGSYLQNGPNVTLNYWFRMGLGNATSSGYAELDAGTLAVGGRLQVGESGTAVFTMKGGTLTTGDNIGLADGGGTGKGTFNQSGGNATDGNELWVGNNVGSVGTVNLSGNANLTVNSWLAIGRNGSTGVINLSGNATLTKAGANVITFAGLTGASANGTINQTNGTVNSLNNDTWLGEDGIGTWNMYGGAANLALLQIGRNGSSKGYFNLNGGILSVNQIALGSGYGEFHFNGGTLRARASNANFMSGVTGYFYAGGAVIDSQGYTNTIASPLVDFAGGGLTKIGNGTLILTGPNSYTGLTTVNGGKLVEDVSTFVSGPVTVANTAGLGLNLSYAFGQINHSSLTFSGPANTLDYTLGGFGNPTLAPINVTGTLTINGNTTVNIFDTLAQVGQIPLMTYANRSGTGSFVLGSLPLGIGANLIDDTVNKVLILNITSTAVIRWDGEVAGGVWDVNTTTNWTDYATGLPAKYTTGAAVYFDDAALGTTTVNLGVNVLPISVIVTNNIIPSYTITGTGSISGSTSLTKQGTNSLTLATTNNYTGATVISGGTVIVSQLANGLQPSPIGASSSGATNLVFDGGTLSYTGPATTIDRGYTIQRSSTLDLQNDLKFNGVINPIAFANFAKTGPGRMSITRAGVNTLSAGGGGAAVNVQGGSLLLDGSTGGGQTNNINGELWVAGTTNAQNSTVIITNSTLNLSSWLAISRGSGTAGVTSSVSLYNSKLTSGNLSLGFDGTIAGSVQYANLSLNGNSTYTNNGVGNFCESSGSTTTISLKDSSVFYSANQVYVAQNPNSTGTVSIANSAKIVVNSWFSVGSGGGTGNVLLKDNASLQCGDFNVNDVNAGSATFVAQDNANVHAGNMWVGKGNGSTGYLLVSNNAAILSDNGLTLGQGTNSIATVDLAGGSSLAVNLVQGSPGRNSLSTFNFNGGKVIAHPPYFGPDFMFSLDVANIMGGGAVIEIDNSDVRHISQPLLAGDGLGGGLTKIGNGTLLLDGVSTYTGSTLVSTGTFGGGGTLAGPVTVAANATLSPGGGTAITTLTVNNNLTLSGNLLMTVNETNTPATNSMVVVSGALTTSGTGTAKITNLGPALNVGDRFVLFSKPLIGAGTMAVSGSGMTWKNDLATDGSITALAIAIPPTFASGGTTRLPDGNIALTATGSIGAAYRLWATTNLTLSPISSTWTLLQSGTVTTSPFTINDLTATNFAQRFYIFSAP